MDNNAILWHYEKSGERGSPVSDEEILKMIEKGELGYGDAVWNQSLRDWVPLEASPFAATLQKCSPPPRVSNSGYVVSNDPSPGRGAAIASLALGIVSIVFLLTGLGAFISLVTSIIGVCVGYSAKKRAYASDRTMAKAGYICSIISLAIIILVTLLMLFGLAGLLAINN